MGNEGSMPEVDDLDEFEYQARSPPSATLPGASSNGPKINGGAQQGGGGGRLKGSVFTRRNNAHNQNSTGIERAPGAMENLDSPYPANSMVPGDDSTYAINPGMGGQPPQHQLQPSPYPSHTAQHPTPYSQQPYTQQTHAQQQQQQSYSSQGSYQQQHAKKTRPGQRAGAAILNGMRNLNIGSAMTRISGGGSPSRSGHKRISQKRQQQPQQTVNEWETRWDEDSDDDDDEDIKPQQTIVPTPTTALTPQLHPPDLDSGYSGAASAAAAVVTPSQQISGEAPLPQQQQTHPSQNGAAAVTPGPLAGTPVKPSAPAVTDDENDEDGVEWDTGAASGAVATDDDTSTPNVKQFLPLLRVLGKGSFGKVRFEWHVIAPSISTTMYDTDSWRIHEN